MREWSEWRERIRVEREWGTRKGRREGRERGGRGGEEGVGGGRRGGRREEEEPPAQPGSKVKELKLLHCLHPGLLRCKSTEEKSIGTLVEGSGLDPVSPEDNIGTA